MKRFFILALCAILSISPVLAGSMTLLGVGAPAAAGGSFATYTSTSSDATHTAAATQTYNSVPIGTAASNRVVVVIWNADGATVSTITVDGGGGPISLTKQVDEPATFTTIGLWSGTVAVGSSATIVVTSTGLNLSNSILQVGSFNSGASTTPSATTHSTTTNCLATLTIPSGGFAVTGAVNNGTQTFTGWTNATQDVLVQATGAGMRMTTAHNTTAGSQAMTSNMSAATACNMVSAAWGP